MERNHRPGFIILFGSRNIVSAEDVPPVDAVCPNCKQQARIFGRAYRTLLTAFQPDHFNYAFLQNQDRHVHCHVIPRYAGTRRFAGMEFTDPDYPGHYTALNAARRLPDDALAAISKELRARLPEAARGASGEEGGGLG